MSTHLDELPLESPIGTLRLLATDEALVAVGLPDQAQPPVRRAGRRWEIRRRNPGEHPVLDRARVELAEYFAGERLTFDLPLAPDGTDFQKEVWRALMTIPFGATWSYAELAAGLGRPSASRAVGGANGSNPIAVIVPCHRVIGADGSLTGYAGGLARKEWLLRHERAGAKT